ncbi:PhzF family phenazine biosynthesis protein [Neobacillus mesonae]|nr:PhzF family phenazine biosynthesis protein [Neobacillus mesonae]
MEIEVYTLNAFAKEEHGGNPAGVVLHSDTMAAMPETIMQETARIVGLSETAFFEETDEADYKIRYFTPNSEVDLCGHATIAAFYLLWIQGRIDLGTHTLLTKAGMLEVTLEENGEVFLTQTPPRYFEHVDRTLIADSLQISPDDLVPDLPVQIVSTGLRDILVPIKSSQALKDINPNFEQITKISRDYQVIGYHLFTLDVEPEVLAECRNFAPLYDIPEESATGTSNGALTCYLWNNSKLPDFSSSEYMIKQGFTMNRPSEVKTRLMIDTVNQEISKVQVGGMATNIEVRKISF